MSDLEFYKQLEFLLENQIRQLRKIYFIKSDEKQRLIKSLSMLVLKAREKRKLTEMVENAARN